MATTRCRRSTNRSSSSNPHPTPQTLNPKPQNLAHSPEPMLRNQSSEPQGQIPEYKALKEAILGYCPHTVTVYKKATIKGLIYPYYDYYSTVTEWGQYPSCNQLSSETAGKNPQPLQFFCNCRVAEGETMITVLLPTSFTSTPRAVNPPSTPKPRTLAPNPPPPF